MARFFGSMFLPLFRYWGETEAKPGRVFIAKNYGLVSLVCAFRVFNRPLSLIIINQTKRPAWLKALSAGGLGITLASDKDAGLIYEKITSLINEGRAVLLLIPKKPSENVLMLVDKLKRSVTALFMAVSGAEEAVPKRALIAKVADVSVFCALPYVSAAGKGAIYELEMLESVIKNVPLGSVPTLLYVKNVCEKN